MEDIMTETKLNFKPKFKQSERIRFLEKHNLDLAISGKRNLKSGMGDQTIVIGDHACWIDIGPFPKLDEVPSRNNYEMNGESWGRDYAFMIDNTPANINPWERIVGEIYWHMSDVRRYDWADTKDPEYFEITEKANEIGVSGVSSGHTCPDLEIGLRKGYGKILEDVKKYKAMYERLDNPKRAKYLHGLEMICESNIRYIQRYAALAQDSADKTDDLLEKERFMNIKECCENIATKPPQSYVEAVQWIYFAVLFDRSVGHGNGYGRIDLYLIDFYKKDMAAGIITREEARELVCEIYMKLRGHFFSMGGRDEDLNDATNEMSWVALEAYDLIGDYNNIAVMWHPDIDKDYYAYACDVLARHGESLPILVNFDVMYESELRNGIPHKHAWQVSFSGCQWYCIPGREYCDQDTNTIIAVLPMNRAIDRAIADHVEDFETLYEYFTQEMMVSGKTFRDLKRVHDAYLSDIWPEMFTSLLCHGPIERGQDCKAPRGVDYQHTSVNILGIPNVSDSLFAIQQLVFNKKKYTLKEVREAYSTDWKDNEPMRLRFRSEEKYGNDYDGPDEMYCRTATMISDQLIQLYNQKGQEFRPSLFHYQGHLTPEKIGATPDGRHVHDYLAHGVNPTVGMNTRGLIPTANSLTTPDLRKFQGSPLQVDLQPRFFDGKEEIWKYLRDFSIGHFKSGGVQINLHIMDMEKLKDAMENPDKPEYQNLVVRVTGYCARFVVMDRAYQEEFVGRMSYDSL